MGATLHSIWLETQMELPDSEIKLRRFKKSASSGVADFSENGMGGESISREQLAQMLAQLRPGGRIELSDFTLVLDANDQIHFESTKAIGLDEVHRHYDDRTQQQMQKSAGRREPSFGAALQGLWALGSSEEI
jgi:hypothetical protein